MVTSLIGNKRPLELCNLNQSPYIIIYYNMAPKTKSPEKVAFYSCSECHSEFTGSECPTCGNKEDNVKLAADGLAQSDHKKKVIFGDLSSFKRTDDIINPTSSLADEVAQMDYETAKTNIRDMYVLKTDINKKELEMKALQKKRELEEFRKSGELPGQYQNSYGSRPGQMGMNPGMQPDPYQQSIFPQYSPQAALVSSLTRMDKDKRKDFLDQLSEASPEALHALSGMMQNPQQQQQYVDPRMYGGMGMSPYGLPPWMMPPQHQPQQQEQTNPLDMAVSIIQTFSELNEKNKPHTDDSIKEMLREQREEIKALRERVQSPASTNPDIAAILNKMNDMQTQINQSHQPKSVGDSIKEISTLLTGFREIGLIKEPVVPGETVDDKIKMKELEHKIKVEEKQQELEEKKLSAQEHRTQLGQKIFMSALQGSMFKNKTPENPEKKQGNVNPAIRSSYITEKPTTKETIINEVSTEAGVVRETRPTVKSLNNVVV